MVEDDKVFYDTIRLHLSRQGWQCEWFAYAPSDMNEIRDLRADVALIDVNLRLGNGIDLIEQLLASGIHMPVIVMTGYVDAADQVQARAMSHVQVLMKPFDLSQLQDSLSQALDQAA